MTLQTESPQGFVKRGVMAPFGSPYENESGASWVPERLRALVGEAPMELKDLRILKESLRFDLKTSLKYLYTSWWFGTCFIFFHILGITIPTDELIFFRGVGIPPTSIATTDPTSPPRGQPAARAQSSQQLAGRWLRALRSWGALKKGNGLGEKISLWC